jgi:hypothetical protein
VIPLANGKPYTNTAPPGFPTNLLYSFTVTNTNAKAVQFTVNNLSAPGNLELLVDDGVFPTPTGFYNGSFNPGMVNQFVSIVTNASLVTLSGTVWYAAVPNTSAVGVSYSITASVVTNGNPTNAPLFLGANITSPNSGFTMYWTAEAGQAYTVWASADLINWTAVALVTGQNSVASYTDAVPVNTQPARYFRLSTGMAPTTPSFISASIASPPNGFTMNWTAEAGQSYTISVSTNLTSWTTVTNVIAQGVTGTYTDAVPAISQQSRFFRIATP